MVRWIRSSLSGPLWWSPGTKNNFKNSGGRFISLGAIRCITVVPRGKKMINFPKISRGPPGVREIR